MGAASIKSAAVFIAVSLGAGGLSGLLSGNSMSSFQKINRPPLSPPGIVFPIVWTVLYILMGVGAFLVFRSDSPKKKRALVLFAVQLAVNFAWSPIFSRCAPILPRSSG
jgi:tryptophan-rich sensory protein